MTVRSEMTSTESKIFDFERTTGMVAPIKGEGASKSAELAEALSGTKKIVVCTLQTFPFALAEVRRLAATQGQRFAVIADEAHSSQSGEAAAKLKSVFSPEELAERGDGGEVSTEGLLAAQMAARANETGLTFARSRSPSRPRQPLRGPAWRSSRAACTRAS